MQYLFIAYAGLIYPLINSFCKYYVCMYHRCIFSFTCYSLIFNSKYSLTIGYSCNMYLLIAHVFTYLLLKYYLSCVYLVTYPLMCVLSFDCIIYCLLMMYYLCLYSFTTYVLLIFPTYLFDYALRYTSYFELVNYFLCMYFLFTCSFLCVFIYLLVMYD